MALSNVKRATLLYLQPLIVLVVGQLYKQMPLFVVNVALICGLQLKQQQQQLLLQMSLWKYHL